MTFRFPIHAIGRAALCALASTAQAQTASAPVDSAASSVQDVAPLDTVVVKGSRASTAATVSAKLQARGITDGISQDEVGRLPDYNIVEAVRRVAGISVVGGGDPTKNRDIYQRASIRGLDSRYNLVTLDGNPIASADQQYRGARLDMLPASSVGRIEIMKTLSAENDPHALGGQLNLVSRSAFDARRDSSFMINALGGNNSSAGQLVSDKRASYKVDATGSVLFGTQREFGLIVSSEVQHLPSTAASRLPGDTAGAGWTYTTATGARTPFASQSANGIMSPVRTQDFLFQNMRDRVSINGKLEYRPSESTQMSLFAGHFRDKDDETRWELLDLPAASGAGSTPDNAGANPAAPFAVTGEQGRFARGDLQQGIVYQPVTRTTNVLTLDGTTQPWNGINLRGTASTSKATYREYRNMIKYAGSVKPGAVSSQALPSAGYGYKIADGAPQLSLNDPAGFADGSSYVGLYWRDINRDIDNKVDFLRLQFDQNIGRDDRGLGWRVGLNSTRTRQSYDQRYVEQTPADAAAQSVIGPLANVMLPQTPASKSFSGIPFLLVDRGVARQLQQSQPGLFVTTDQRANNFGDDYRLTETINAGYGELLYQTDSWLLQAGLRRDATKVDVDAFSAPIAAGSSNYLPTSQHGEYAFNLPSLFATYELTDDMRLKAGWGETIGRPDFVQYAARQTFGVTPSGALTINQGNSTLKPRQAKGFDLSYEWYLGASGLFSSAVFQKDIRNEIFTSQQIGPSTVYQGKTYTDVTISQPLNAAKGQVRGLELQYVNSRLPRLTGVWSGLGFSSNLTLLRGWFDQPTSAASQALGGPAVRRTSGLLRQPNHIANVTVFHTLESTDVRLSVNRIGRSLELVDQDTPERDLYSQARTQVDLQASWKFAPGATATLQVQNLTRAPFIVRQGPGQGLLNNEFPVGRSIFAGLSYQIGR